MKPALRRVLPAVAAVLAFSALSVATASAAAPEFKVAGGKFPTTFTGTSEAVHIETPGGGYTCSSSSISGEITGPKEVSKVVIKFGSKGGCSSFCIQTGHEGWETKEMKGAIGYLSQKEGTKVGLLLEPTTEPVANCTRGANGANTKIIGSVIGELGPLHEQRKAFNLEYAKSGSIQEFRSFEGEEVIHDLRPSLSPQGAIEAKMSLTTAKEVEIS